MNLFPLVKPTGFREYDARWLFEKEINLMGVQALGMGLGTLVHEMGVRPDIVTGHDFRGYSSSIKYALISGMMAAGLRVKDIGLALSPMAYFGQFELDCPCVAMVTASHNDNGWTGVKMGAEPPDDLRARGDGTPAGHRAQRRFQAARGRRLRVRRKLPRPLYRRPHRPAEAQAQAEGRRRLRQRHGGRLRAQRCSR